MKKTQNKIKLFFLGFLFISMLSCTESFESIENEKNLTVIEKTEEQNCPVDFESVLNPSKSDWNLCARYIDTLKFTYFDGNYDYWYAHFQTKTGEDVYFACDTIIPDDLSQSSFKIEWGIDSLFEAGEGDELYYKERLYSYSIIERGEGFSEFLRNFVQAYSGEGDLKMGYFMHDALNTYMSTNPGVMCYMDVLDKVDTTTYIDSDCIISDKIPEGDFCEGYGDTKDGLYYEFIEYSEVPQFYIPTEEGDFEYVVPELPSVAYSRFARVTGISSVNYYRTFYFIEVEGRWYLWLINACDCSA